MLAAIHILTSSPTEVSAKENKSEWGGGNSRFVHDLTYLRFKFRLLHLGNYLCFVDVAEIKYPR